MPRYRPLALIALVLLLAPALAHEGDDRPHVQSFQETRRVTARVVGTVIEFELDRVSDATIDPIRVTFDHATGRLAYEYREEEARADSAFTFAWWLDALVEYTDANANAIYDPGIDRLDREYPLDGMRWDVEPPATSDLRGAKVTRVNASGYLLVAGMAGEPARMFLQFAASGAAVRIQHAATHPQDVKMNWYVERFPFRNAGSRLAFVTRIETPAGARIQEQLDRDGILDAVLVSTERRFAFVDWATFVDANSTRDPGSRSAIDARLKDRPTIAEGGAELRALVFSYPRADWFLAHDPTVGFEYAPPEDPPVLPWATLAAIAGAAVGVAAVAGLAVKYRRRGNLLIIGAVERGRAAWNRRARRRG